MDHRADIFSLGVMLYLMLTGRVPRGAAPSATELREGLRPGFDEVIARSMRHERNERYADALAMLADLRSIREDRGGESVVI